MLCRGDHVLLHLRYGFGSYFNLLPGSEWSALLLTYGFPLTIIGMALKARTLSLCTCTTVLDITRTRLTDDPISTEGPLTVIHLLEISCLDASCLKLSLDS